MSTLGRGLTDPLRKRPPGRSHRDNPQRDQGQLRPRGDAPSRRRSPRSKACSKAKGRPRDRAKAAVKSAEGPTSASLRQISGSRGQFGQGLHLLPTIDGVVLDRTIEVGQIVASSLQAPVLFTLAADLTKMELRVDIDEADIGIGEGSATRPASRSRPHQEGGSFPAVISQLRVCAKDSRWRGDLRGRSSRSTMQTCCSRVRA